MVVLSWLLLSLGISAGHAASTFGLAEQVSTLINPDVNEVSGLAASRLHPGVFYAHNDHGDTNRIFALQPKTGKLLATFVISGATNYDWEDMAIGPCPNGGSCMYIADIGKGGSGGSPRNIIYRVKEPTTITDQTLPVIDKLQFRWNQPESECLMVDPAGNAYVISRATGMGLMGKLPSFGWGGQVVDVTVTEHLAVHTTHHDPLACDISAYGTEMLIKGKVDLYYYKVTGMDYFAAIRGQGEHLNYHYEHSGQAIAFTSTADGFYTVHEGVSAPFYFYKKGGTVQTTSSPSGSSVSPLHVSAFSQAQRQGAVALPVTEASGLAASRIHPGVYYTHNDHGDHSYIYAVDPKTGNLLATFTISGATNYDWEDVSIGPCPTGGSCIYIADTGKGSSHAHNIIYMVKEPSVIQSQTITVLDQVHFTWSETESECMMVDPSGNVYLISREDGMGLLAKIPSSAFGGPTVHLSHLQSLSVFTDHHDPLACDLSPDGTEMLIHAKDDLYYYAIHNNDLFQSVQGPFVTLPYHHETYGEGIAWTPNVDGYYTISERPHAPFYFYRRLTAAELTTTPIPTTVPPAHIIAGPKFSAGSMVSTVTSAEINKASGLAASRIHNGVYYTHNDHGDSNRIFAIEASSGDLLATMTISGATHWDWEDIAVGPCPGGGSCIYIGDTGNTGGPAKNIIYRVKEPAAIKDQSLTLLDQLHFTWNEKDSECLMVDPSGNAYIISHVQGGGVVAEIPSSAWGGSTYNINATHPLAFNTIHKDPTACDISQDGSQILVKSVDNVYYFNVTNGNYISTLDGAVSMLPYHHEATGQAIAWTPAGDGYYTTGQGYFLPLYYYQKQ